MKKSIVLGMSALVTCAAFVGCSKSADDIFEQNQAAIANDAKTEYTANFEAKYGKVSPTQSWDFTASSAASTRAVALTDICNGVDDPSGFQNNVTGDKTTLQGLISGAAVLDWNPFVSVHMYPVWCYTPSSQLKNKNLNMVVKYNEGQQYTLFTCQMKNGSWWGNQGATGPSQRGKAINTFPMELDPEVNNVSWEFQDSKGGKKSISTYKEVKCNGRVYWCFDYGNGDYTNLIFLVYPNPAPLEKRYLIEDLGSKDDFDFNDIIVDVMQVDGKQKAIIRAMGGTLDFTLKIGDTEWTKSVDGAALGYDVKTMYNTKPIDPTKVYDEFEVTGWDPATNNIKAFVKSNVNDGVIIEIPFPRIGEVPMIIAIKPIWDWQLERSSLPENWWTVAEDVVEEETEE